MSERATVARRMVPDQRRATILRAAGDLFSRHPYADVSVADIAAEAAVSPPLIVFHFGTKKALYLAILATAADAIRAGLADLAGPPSLDRLRLASASTPITRWPTGPVSCPCCAAGRSRPKPRPSSNPSGPTSLRGSRLTWPRPVRPWPPAPSPR